MRPSKNLTGWSKSAVCFPMAYLRSADHGEGSQREKRFCIRWTMSNESLAGMIRGVSRMCRRPKLFCVLRLYQAAKDEAFSSPGEEY